MLDGELDEILRATAHPARRTILAHCTDDWVAAGTLTEELRLAPATVSEHLKVLRKTGLVEMQIDGKWRRYRSCPQRLQDAVRALADATRPTRTTREEPT